MRIGAAKKKNCSSNSSNITAARPVFARLLCRCRRGRRIGIIYIKSSFCGRNSRKRNRVLNNNNGLGTLYRR